MHKTKIEKLRWHKQKFIIRCIAWLTILSFLIVLLLMGFPIVSDAAETKISDTFFIKDILNSDDAKNYYTASAQNQILSNSSYSPFTSKDIAFSYYDSLKSFFDVEMTFQNNEHLFIFCRGDDSSNLYFIKHGLSTLYGNCPQVGLKTINFQTDYIYKFDVSTKKITTIRNGGGNLRDYTSDWFCLFSDVQIMYDASPISSSQYSYNYLLVQDLQGKGSGGFDVSDPDTSIVDNMYLNQGSGLVLSSSSLNNGKLYIVALPNITQHADDYSIRLTANGSVNFTPKSNVSLFMDGYSMASAFGISIGQTFDRNFTLASNDGDFVDIPLSSFNNGFYEYDLSSLNATTRVNGGYDSPYSDLANYLSSNVNKWSNVLYPITSYIGGAKSVGVESYSVSVPEIINNVNDLTKIVVNSAYCDYSMQIVDKKGNASQGVITYHADFVNPSNSSNIIDTLTRTPEQVSEKTTPDNSYNYSPQYPYKPNDNNSIIYPDSSQNNDNSSNSNNNVSVSGGDNSVINNVTVTQNDKYPQKGVMTSFLKIINQDKNDAIKYIGDTSGINGYLHLMQVSMSWIPQEVWSVWISYLKAILGICVGAFFLKILVNWST